jgi:hypothetical protein
MQTITTRCIQTLAISLAAIAPAHAQTAANPLDSLISRNYTTFTLQAGVLSGPGAGQILAASDGAQFVALGENHNTAAIPDFTVALFKELHDRYGFNHVALEEGPVIGEALSRSARNNSNASAVQLGLRWPSAFHMYTEEELRMMDRLAAVSTGARPLWGVNQEFGAAHVLARLVEIAPTARAREAAQVLLKTALDYEAERFMQNKAFISSVLRPADLAALRESYASQRGSEADFLIEQLALSNTIYAPYSTTPTPHFTAFFESGYQREQNMKHLFARYYREQLAHGEPPKVLVKSGHVHLNRGVGPSNEVLTLGNFLSELATFEGGHSVHLYVLLNWSELATSFFAPFARHIQPTTNTVFDLRPIHAWAAKGKLPNLDPRLQRVLCGYDFVVILNDMKLGSIEALKTPRFRRYPE